VKGVGKNEESDSQGKFLLIFSLLFVQHHNVAEKAGRYQRLA
jgi:hypothetical protein